MISHPDLLRRVALFARQRHRLVFLAFAALTLVAVGLLTRLQLDTDLLNLLPQQDPIVETFRETMERFGSIDYLLVVVRIPEGEVLAPYESFADRLGERLQELPQISAVEYRLGETEELLEELYPKAVLFLDAEGRQLLEAKLTDEAIRQRVAEMRRLVSTPQGTAAKRLLTLDPFGLADVFLGRLDASRGALDVDWASGYYVSRDHRLLLLLAKPVRPPQDVDFDQELVTAVEAAVEEERDGWHDILGFDSQAAATAEGFPAPPEVVLGGSYLTALDDARFIVNDALIGFATAFAGVLLLFLVAFRRLGPLLFAAVPLACGLLLTFGFAALTVGKLSTATSGVAALLIGLGIDFVIVSYGRYVEERQRGATVEEALLAMSGSSGRAVVVGAVTTAATFYAFLVTRFEGLRQMGFLTGSGILLCMVAVLLLLPALLAWREERHRRKRTGPRLYLHSFGTRHLVDFSMRRPVPVMVAGAVLTAAALVATAGLEFQESTTTMRPAGNRGIEVGREVGERFGAGFDYMMLVVEGATPDEAIARADRAAEEAQALVEQGVIYRYNAITSLIPPPRQQAAVLDWVERERLDSLDVRRAEATFRQALAAEGLRAEPFEPGLRLVAAALTPERPIRADDFTDNEQTRKLLERYLQPTEEGGWASVVYLYPPDNRWRREAPPAAVEAAERLGPETSLTGTNRLNERVRTIVRRDAWIAGILGLVLVVILLYLDFHRVRHTLLALVPLAVGIAWMLGAMAVLDIDLNFMNIFVTTMIIGIGVDYGLHAVHRYREMRGAPQAELRRGLVETGNAIVVAALSTVAGFGSLVFSHYPGLRSMGIVAILGAVFTAFVAVTLLPAFFSWLRARPAAGQAGAPRPR
ncbi:MAG TPA: efflux RND transporter permease subunit [Thermoanaerobaculia bacterium]|nr:efflux RND transporter permease subunit [Thermoanaerobaculia bacterium]